MYINRYKFKRYRFRFYILYFDLNLNNPSHVFFLFLVVIKDGHGMKKLTDPVIKQLING